MMLIIVTMSKIRQFKQKAKQRCVSCNAAYKSRLLFTGDIGDIANLYLNGNIAKI